MSQFSDWERDYGSPYDHVVRKQATQAEPPIEEWLRSLPFPERIEAELCLPCPGGCGQSSLGCTCGRGSQA